MAVIAPAAASFLSSIRTSSTSSTSFIPLRARLIDHTFPKFPSFFLSPKPNPANTLKLASQSLSLRLLSPVGLFRSASLSDDLQASIEADQEVESELSDSETDQLLEHEHEQEEEEEDEDIEEERKKSSPSADGRLYVGNLPYSITSIQLADIFVEAGAVRSVEIIYDRVTDRSRGFAFVTMATVEDAEKAIRMFDSSQIGGRTVRVNFPEVPRGGEQKVLETKIKTSYQTFMDTPNKLYAGNLSWSVTSQSLRDVFSGQPGFLSAKVIFERETGKSRGFGFVSFSSAEEARAAVAAMNGVEVDGRSLRLNMASERARPPPPPTVDLNSEEAINKSEALSGASS
ncbi:hypothetical protein V2J09_018599 [Rumex salicifolius]